MTGYDAARLVVDFARLRETSAHLHTAATTLESELARLEQDARALAGVWSGAAQQAYEERQRTWRQASAELTGILRSIRRALDESIVDYEAAERHNADLFR
jgi:early secretory antigenic target protein ESAT-6